MSEMKRQSNRFYVYCLLSFSWHRVLSNFTKLCQVLEQQFRWSRLYFRIVEAANFFRRFLFVANGNFFGLTSHMLSVRFNSLLLCNFACLLIFQNQLFKKKTFQEYHQSVKQLGFRSGPTICRA